jgi:hypothetical protein
MRQSRNKYGNRRIEVAGEKFDSQKEYARWCELKLLQKAGAIQGLQRQVSFELQPAFYHKGKRIQAIRYVADFVYTEDGEQIIEDARKAVREKRKAWREIEKRLESMTYEMPEDIIVLPYRKS